MDHISTEQKIFWIDLFCGAGGTSEGIEKADANATVVACVNHDKKALESHEKNHPNCLHIREDIRDFKVVMQLSLLFKELRKKYPNCIFNLWASLDCTNQSNAKGGLPKDPDSRTLANHLEMYLKHLDVNYLYVENVREFRDWGPMMHKTIGSGLGAYCPLVYSKKYKRWNPWLIPIKEKKGECYKKWVSMVESYGFDFEHDLLNAADFAAYTSRLRYFGIFSKRGLPIVWPEPTHAKNPKEGSKLKRWKKVKDVLDLTDEGKSIFERKIPLVENSEKRIYAGLIKIVAGGEHNFIQQRNSGNPKSKVISLNQPARTITKTGGNQEIVKTVFLSTYYNKGGNTGIEQPCPTITTKDRVSKIHPQFFVNSYSNGGQTSDLNNPAPTVLGIPKSNLVTTKTWLMDHQFNNKGRSINETGPTIIARQDKKPLYIINCKDGLNFGIVVFESDSETMVKIKEFMALYGIMDIKMRMLRIDELKRIQGFPEEYQLVGTKTDQKRFIGNAVEVNQAKALIEANTIGLRQYFKSA